MAFIITPRFVPSYQAPQCGQFGFCAPVSRPRYSHYYRPAAPRQPAFNPFNDFLGGLGELLGEIDREVQKDAHLQLQREAHRQRQLRKRTLRQNFAVGRSEEGWQVVAEVPGFEQQNISIEVAADDNAVTVSGDTHWGSEVAAEQQPPAEEAVLTATTPEQESSATEGDKLDDVHDATLDEAEVVSAPATDDTASDAGSRKSFQATVEDDLEDFEDLGAETSPLIRESKGKQKATDEPAAPVEKPSAQAASTAAPQPTTEEQEQEGRVHGAFQRTFRFPERIDAANVKASMKDGVLRITVPRAPKHEIRKVSIL